MIFKRWTEQSAYIYGLWFADGSIFLQKQNKKYYKRFDITNTDKQIMSKIAAIMNTKLYRYKRKDKPNWLICYCIRLYSQELFDFCYKITGTNKSKHNLNLPNIPRKVFKHFIRGYFDGDGSIHHVTYNNRHGKQTIELRTSFTAGIDTGNLLEKLRDAIRTYIPIGFRKVTGRKSHKIAFGQYDSALLCNWMYSNATIFMNRKKKIWDKSDKKRLLESKKFFTRNKT